MRIPVEVVCGGQFFRFRGVVVHHRAARGKGQNQPRRKDKGKASFTGVPFWLNMTVSEFAAWIEDANAVEKERKKGK